MQSGSHLRLHGSWLATHWRCRSVCSSLRLLRVCQNGSGRCACLTHPSRRKHIAAPLFQLETVNTGTVRLCATRLCRCGDAVLADFERCALLLRCTCAQVRWSKCQCAGPAAHGASTSIHDDDDDDDDEDGSSAAAESARERLVRLQREERENRTKCSWPLPPPSSGTYRM